MARLFENDHRTVLGKTLSFLCRECGLNRHQLDKLTPGLVKNHIGFDSVLENAEWVPGMARELMRMRDAGYNLDGFSSGEIDEMLDYVCTK